MKQCANYILDIASGETKTTDNFDQKKEPRERWLLRLAKTGDHAARQDLLRMHLRLVTYIAKRYARHGAFMEVEDLIQYGCVGLLRAIEKFDLEYYSRGKRVRFVTYATYWIRHSIRRAIQNHGRTITIPVTIQKDIHVLRCASSKNNRVMESQIIALHLGISRKRWDTLILAPREAVTIDGFSEGNGFPQNSWPLPESSLDSLERMTHEDDTRRYVRGFIDLLPQRQKLILELLYGLTDKCLPRTAVEVGERLGISAQRVGQLKTKALKTLKNLIEARMRH